MIDTQLEKEFLDFVMNDVRILKEKYDYNPSFFLKMISQYGAVDTAKRLIHSSKPSEGYTKLWEIKALKYSVENQIQDKRWKDIFTDDEREKAKKRLSDYGFQIE